MIRCPRFRPYEKNTLRGFADLELTRVGLVLRDCTYHRHASGKRHVSSSQQQALEAIHAPPSKSRCHDKARP